MEKELGRGGFGAAYLARRMKDNQRIALKVMLSQVAVDKSNLEQFLREIRNVLIAEALEHRANFRFWIHRRDFLFRNGMVRRRRR